MEIERSAGGARAPASPPSVGAARAAARVRAARPSEVPPPSGRVVFDEAIDIHLGVDRQSGHLAIVGGDVRVEPRPADRPAPGALAPPTRPGPDDPPRLGSIVNVVA